MSEDLIQAAYVNEEEIRSEIRKSAAAGERLVRTTCIRRTQAGRDGMDATQRFLSGGGAFAMANEVVEVWMSEDARRDVRERLMKSSPGALPAFDAGRIWESDLLKVLPDAMEAEPARAAVHEEPLMKAKPEPDRGIFDPPATFKSVKKDFIVVKPEDAPALMRKAYDGAVADGAIDLREAAQELAELAERFSKRGR